MAKLDPLTGLLDSRNLDRRLDYLLDRADEAREPLSLIVLDLGGLRQVNEKHGREAGDLVLQTVARVLAGAVSEPLLTFRLGGDAFVVILPGCDADATERSADELKAAIGSTRARTSAGVDIPLSASTGLATYPADGGTSRALVRCADRRMQASKAAPLVET